MLTYSKADIRDLNSARDLADELADELADAETILEDGYRKARELVRILAAIRLRHAKRSRLRKRRGSVLTG